MEFFGFGKRTADALGRRMREAVRPRETQLDERVLRFQKSINNAETLEETGKIRAAVADGFAARSDVAEVLFDLINGRENQLKARAKRLSN